MESSIIKNLQVPEIARVAKNLMYTDKQLLELFFESGMDYIEKLKKAVKNRDILKRQFGQIMSSGYRITPEATFKKIASSPAYWRWWISIFWETCNFYDGISRSEFRFLLSGIIELIPSETLSDIFQHRKVEQTAKKRELISI